MNKSQIAHIVYSGFGGTTDYIFNLIRGDKQNEFGHSIIFYGVEETSAENLSFAKSISVNVFLVIKKPGRDKSALKELKLILHNISATSITLHVNSLIVDKNKWMPKDARLLFVEHQANHLKSKKEWIFSGLAQYRASAIISLTEESQNTIQKKLNVLYRKKKNLVIATGLFMDDYRCNENKSVFKIGMIGRINEFRDYETLIRAFLEIKNSNIELHIAGDGPLALNLKTKYSSSKITFHGLLNRNEIADFLAGLSLYVHASFGETSSLAIRQAQASKLPIIASNVVGIKNVLNGFAILVEPGDVDKLKNEIENIIANASLRQELINKSNEANLNGQSCFNMFDAYKKLFA